MHLDVEANQRMVRLRMAVIGSTIVRGRKLSCMTSHTGSERLRFAYRCMFVSRFACCVACMCISIVNSRFGIFRCVCAPARRSADWNTTQHKRREYGGNISIILSTTTRRPILRQRKYMEAHPRKENLRSGNISIILSGGSVV